MTEEDEEWRDIPGLDGYYQASSHGRVRRYTGKVLKGGINDQGYRRVNISLPGRALKTVKVHALVAAAFHGERPAHMEVRHLDGDKLNNLPGNLAYGTHAENMGDLVEHRGHFYHGRNTCKRGHPLEYGHDNTMIHRNGARQCRECRKIKSAEYRALNRDKMRQWRAENSEHIREYNRERRQRRKRERLESE